MNNRTENTGGVPLLQTEDVKHYRSVVGKLMWLIPLRPDMNFATKELSRALQGPTDEDYAEMKHLLQIPRCASKTTSLSSRQATAQRRIKRLSLRTSTPTGPDARPLGNRHRAVYYTSTACVCTTIHEHKRQSHYHMEKLNCMRLALVLQKH